jgi:hypothetical protein
MAKFCDVFNKLIRVDGHKPEQIRAVIDWVTAQTETRNGFCWADQFMSPLKLKKKNKDGIKYIDVWISEMTQNQKPTKITSDDDPDCQQWVDKHRRPVNA